MHSTSGMDFSTLTFILAGGQGKRLSPFTSGRAKPLVSFGGVFQIIDFTLSNCVNSGLERAYLLTQYKADSVRSYIEASSWATDFVCLPSSPSSGYHGTADSVYKNMHLFSQREGGLCSDSRVRSHLQDGLPQTASFPRQSWRRRNHRGGPISAKAFQRTGSSRCR